MTILKSEAPEEIIFSGKMFEIIHQKMTDGERTITFEIARRAPGTRIIFVREGKILLTQEYRYELDRYDYRLPGGKVFDRLSDYRELLSANGNIEEAARVAALRESKEEVGLVPDTLSLFSVSTCGATIKWDLYYFTCRSFKANGAAEQESGEEISSRWYEIKDVEAMCLDGRIDEERSAMALLKLIRGVSNE